MTIPTAILGALKWLIWALGEVLKGGFWLI